MSADVATSVSASSLAELSWVGAGGPQVRGVVALVYHGRPALAFTYADEQVARAVAAAPSVALSLTERRSTGASFRPLLVHGVPTLVEDPTGDLYRESLLLQELHRYPPARVLADSPLLQREHWWYLPRLIVSVEVEEVRPLPERSGAGDHLLVVAEGGTPVVRPARLRDTTADPLLPEVDGDVPPAGPAVMFGQDASFPDLERWAQWHFRGHWDGERLAVAEAPARTGLGAAPGLIRRWRRQRELERRCIAAIPPP